MKKIFLVGTLVICVFMANAQSGNKELRDTKREANKELNREIRVGNNGGDRQKVNDAKEAKRDVRDAKTPEAVRDRVKEYRGGSSENRGGGRRIN